MMPRIMNPMPNNITPPSMVQASMDPRRPLVPAQGRDLQLYEVPLQRQWGRDDGFIQPPDTTGNKNYRPISMGGTVSDPENGYFPMDIPIDDVLNRNTSNWPSSFKVNTPIGVNQSILFDYPYIPPPDYTSFPSDTTQKIPKAIEVNKQPPDVHDSASNQRKWNWETITTYPRPWNVPPSYKPNRRELSDSGHFFHQPTKKLENYADITVR
ncbi:MAG: hypothetical protein WB421_13965 [Terriglobales bacterium]